MLILLLDTNTALLNLSSLVFSTMTVERLGMAKNLTILNR